MPESINTNNKKIAKNTIFLYIRMFLMMGVSLYTSRMILQILGIEDFGIYNVVAGIVVLFSFLNNAMAIVSQRFLSFALGKNEKNEVERVFSLSLTSHIIIALIVILIAETIGLYFLYKMNFPQERITAINWTYQIAVITCCINIIRVPYNASIIAYEKMSFYAWISIIEVVLKLIIVFFLLIIEGDKLIYYSLLLLGVTIIINTTYKLYCNNHFPISKYHFFWDSKLFKEFIGFSGWSLAGSLANVGAQQGLNMIINIFCGVIVNAAVGICNQVTAAVSQFLGNFQTAFNPQLVKSYASGDKAYFLNLIIKSSKFSYFLMLIISVPVIINCNFFLTIWLGEIPKYAVEFSQLMIIYLLVDAISGPLWISVQATGKIKNYQLLMASLILMNLPLSLLLMYLKLSPIYIFVGRVIINIITLIARIVYLKQLIALPIYRFMKEVIGKIFLVTLVAVPLPFWIKLNTITNWTYVIFTSFICIITSSLSIYLLGLTKGEKSLIYTFFYRKIIKR